MARIPLANFKTMLKRGDLPGPGILHKQSAAVVEPLKDRRIRFTISTGAVDRDGDTVSVAGWNLGAFLRNPVVLWGHNSDELPIARCIDIGVVGNALKAMVEFVPGDMPGVGPRAEAVLRMCRTGFLSATSVGFLPLEFEIAKDRGDDDAWFPPIDFKRQEMCEFSIVSIPSNPEALIDPAYQVPVYAPEVAQALAAPRRLAPRSTSARAAYAAISGEVIQRVSHRSAPRNTLDAIALGYTGPEIAQLRRTGKLSG